MTRKNAVPASGIRRRALLQGTGAAALTAAVAALRPSETPLAAQEGTTQVYLPLIHAGGTGTSSASIEVIALNRMAYGPRPGDIARVREMGFPAYVEEQLNPTDDDPVADQRIADARLKLKIDDVTYERPLSSLTMSAAELWALKALSYGESTHPVNEVRAATWIRAVYSRWQLREVLVEFWHNHFNVNANAYREVAMTFPLYDRIMRQHCLGNFRAFLEAVAQSVAMLYYLNNLVSRDGPANENYARELFELHGLGAEHYINDLYDNFNDVPRDDQDRPVGYIDWDVYEAARAFTGWTIANGRGIGNGAELPDTGEFTYVDSWHDNALKIVLGEFFSPNQPPLADGRRVLDLVAAHPGTARHVCYKLCQRLVADNPPEALVNAAVQTWLANLDADNQIQQTVRTILLADAFRTTWGQKVKRPFEAAVAFLRATNADFTYGNLGWSFNSTGYQHFSWPTPTGHPDTMEYWLSTGTLLGTWRFIQTLPESWLESGTIDLEGEMPADVRTSRQMVDFWIARLLGRSMAANSYTLLLDHMRAAIDADDPPLSPDEPPDGFGDEAEWRQNAYRDRIKSLVFLICLSPDFMLR
ncbi:MAG: DUF1800 domain-containing protein [Chloroflexaceae bacterium]